MKKLNELLNLETEETEKTELVVIDSSDVSLSANEIDQKFVELIDVEEHCENMDRIAKTAMETYNTIVELAQNVDERNAAEMYNAAISSQKNALEALNLKNKAKFKAAELLAKKQIADANRELPNAKTVENENGEIVGDRNEILKMLENGE